MKNKYDLFIRKGTEKEPNITYPTLEKGWWQKEACFLGFNESLENIKLIKKELEENKIAVFVVPIAYRGAMVTAQKAKIIAEKEYLKVKEGNPNRYGDLRYYHSHPMWFFFFADDYILQEEGYAPGFWGVYIDKLTGEIVDTKKVKYYQFL